jgi:hypothetical protein
MKKVKESNEKKSNEEESKEEESNKKESKEEESKEDESNEEESNEEESNEEESNEEESNEKESNKKESNKKRTKKKSKKNILISKNTYLIREHNNITNEIIDYEKKQLLSLKSLNPEEKIFFSIFPKKNKKIITEVKFNTKKKTYFIYLNSIKQFINNKKCISYYFCENCEQFYDKDEVILHLIIKKHSVLILYEKKCDLHDKYYTFINIIDNLLYCEDCSINPDLKLIPLISNFDSKIIFSNQEIYYGNVINGKKEGIGIYYYNDSSIFIGKFINDFPQLPGIYKDKNGKSKEIYEEWGDFEEFLSVQNLIENQDFFEEYLKKLVLTIYDIELIKEYDLNNNFKFSKSLIKNSFYSDVDSLDYFIVFNLKNFRDIKLFPNLTKGFQIYIENYRFFEIRKNLENKLESKPIIIDNNKEKLIFYFEQNKNIEKMIEIQKKIYDFSKKNNNYLFDFSIYFIINEDTFSKQIISELLNNENKLNIIFTFLKCGKLKNIFQYTKYKLEPYFMFLNKENIVLKIGLINSFEKKCLDLINKSHHNNSNFLEIKHQLFDYMNNLKSIKLIYNTNFTIKISYKFKFEENKGFILISNSKIKCFGGFRENEYNFFKEKLLKILPEKNIHLNKLEIVNFDIEHLKQICFNCQKILNPQKEIYCCFWCKIAFCEECVENKINNPKNEGFNKLIHKEHNLLYFKTRKKEKFINIDTHKLGKNLFYNIPEKNWVKKHNFLCNGCLKDNLENRYLCLNCRPGEICDEGYTDYCYDCIQHMKKKDEIGKKIETIEDEEIKKLKNKYIEFKHNHQEHIYLNIVVNATNNYYEF